MGIIVLSSVDEMEGMQEKEAKQARNRHKKKNKGDGGVGGGPPAAAGAGTTSSSVVEWARFLPKVVLRVLLVEADDSTRQIIAALLRKCSYRVAAVSDGLKAWEVLKGRSENIDLILTEVELPSISGYALLSLIIEHDSCKNIPTHIYRLIEAVGITYVCIGHRKTLYEYHKQVLRISPVEPTNADRNWHFEPITETSTYNLSKQ